jgi:hypothetical protein
VVCHSTCHLKVAADQFNLILHLFKHAVPHPLLRYYSSFLSASLLSGC